MVRLREALSGCGGGGSGDDLIHVFIRMMSENHASKRSSDVVFDGILVQSEVLEIINILVPFIRTPHCLSDTICKSALRLPATGWCGWKLEYGWVTIGINICSAWLV